MPQRHPRCNTLVPLCAPGMISFACLHCVLWLFAVVLVETVVSITFVSAWTCACSTECNDMNMSIASMVGSAVGPKGLSVS